jgi:hypothetical protein
VPNFNDQNKKYSGADNWNENVFIIIIIIIIIIIVRYCFPANKENQ